MQNPTLYLDPWCHWFKWLRMLCVIDLNDSAISFTDPLSLFFILVLIAESLSWIEVIGFGEGGDCVLHPWRGVRQDVVLRGKVGHCELWVLPLSHNLAWTNLQDVCLRAMASLGGWSIWLASSIYFFRCQSCLFLFAESAHVALLVFRWLMYLEVP